MPGAERRAVLDRQYIERFSEQVRKIFPNCPSKRERAIARHACLKFSGRIGRTAAARDLDPNAVRIAVIAHVRHMETNYDELLARGVDRWDARNRVEQKVNQVLSGWE